MKNLRLITIASQTVAATFERSNVSNRVFSDTAKVPPASGTAGDYHRAPDGRLRAPADFLSDPVPGR